MNRLRLIFFFALILGFGQLAKAQIPMKDASNSFKVGNLWYDTSGDIINAHGGCILYHNKTYYWFGEKRAQTKSEGVNLYTSKDLYNWKWTAVVLAPSSDSTSDIADGCIMERPKVLFNKKTKKYVLWFHLELRHKGYSAARVAVAVSDRITGPFKYVKSFRPNGNMSRDMTLYIDDDGSAYEIYSSRENYDLRIVKLTDDYQDVTTKDSMLFSEHREAPAMFKSNNKYYLLTSGCTGWAPNEANIKVADNIFGPYKSLGNPMKGVDANTSFKGQPAFVLDLPGKKNCFLYVGDKWNPKNLLDSRYLFLPIDLNEDSPEISWVDSWSLDYFKSKNKSKN